MLLSTFHTRKGWLEPPNTSTSVKFNKQSLDYDIVYFDVGIKLPMWDYLPTIFNIFIQIRISTYRLLVPFLGEVEEDAVDDEEGVDDDEEVVGVPKGVETSELFEGFR